MEIIFIIGAIQSFFQVFLLLNKKGKGTPDYILATWMLLMGIHLLVYYVRITGGSETWPYIGGIEGPMPTLHGPLMLLYIQAQNGAIRNWNWKYLLHFAVPICLYLCYTPYFFMPIDELRSTIDSFERNGVPLCIQLNRVFNLVSGVVYVIWSGWCLRKHQKLIGHFFSYEDQVSLKWLRNLVIGMGVIWVVVIISDIAFSLENPPEYIAKDRLIFLTVTLFAFAMGFFGIRSGTVFSDHFEVEKIDVEQENKYEKSGLKPKVAEQYLEQLNQYMIQKKPFLEARLTLPHLSQKTGIAQNHLSQIINERMGKNFYEFINEYRVDEFKKRMGNNNAKNLTLLGHALESGFSSKSAFNETFKKLEGQTPSEYLKSL